MKYSLLAALCVFAMPSFAKDSFSIYLVRHAEKQAVKEDPKLTPCGKLRARPVSYTHLTLPTIYSV